MVMYLVTLFVLIIKDAMTRILGWVSLGSNKIKMSLEDDRQNF